MSEFHRLRVAWVAALAFVVCACLPTQLGATGEVWVVDGAQLHRVDRDGQVLVTADLPGTGFGVAADADGGAWVTLGSSAQLVHVTSNGSIDVAVDTGTAARSAAVAADGSVWAVRSSSDDVLHFAPDGTLLGTHSVASVPYGIAIAETGHVWVTNNFGNSVTRLDADGSNAVTHAVGGFPTGIAVHPDGFVWVVSKDAVQQVDGALGVTVSVTAGLHSRGVAIDREGKVWVTNELSNDVHRFTAAGTPIDVLSVPARPWGISAAGDGSVYVLCSLGGELLRFSSSGQLLGSLPFGYPHAFGDLTGFARAVVVDPWNDADGDGSANRLESDAGFDPLSSLSVPVEFRRGDANGDDQVALGDVQLLLEYLFYGSPVACVEALDCDGGSSVQLGDAVYLLTFLFAGGPDPAAPFLSTGFDPEPEFGLPCLP